MNVESQNNYAVLRGYVNGKPHFSHESRGCLFYRFPLDVVRLSGAVDTIHILARKRDLDKLQVTSQEKLCVAGELRSFNNKSGTLPRLVISLFAQELHFDDGPDENVIVLHGTLCKTPNYRVTPLGREICDLMLAVNRRYGRSDYLPCIAWGSAAKEAAFWNVGRPVWLTGRIQSRIYTKTIGMESIERTAYEVSITNFLQKNSQSGERWPGNYFYDV